MSESKKVTLLINGEQQVAEIAQGPEWDSWGNGKVVLKNNKTLLWNSTMKDSLKNAWLSGESVQIIKFENLCTSYKGDSQIIPIPKLPKKKTKLEQIQELESREMEWKVSIGEFNVKREVLLKKDVIKIMKNQ